MQEVTSIGWVTVIVVGVIGLVITGASFKFFNKAKGDEKDSLGVSLSERFGILALNGIFLLLGALVVALLKFLGPS